MYVNPFVNVSTCPALLLTTTSTTPAPCAGVTAVIVYSSTTWTPVASTPPKVTVSVWLTSSPTTTVGSFATYGRTRTQSQYTSKDWSVQPSS